MNPMVVMTREIAASKHLRIYWNGKPCAKGHDRGRYVKTGACVECIAGYARARVKRINQAAFGMGVEVTVRVPPDKIDDLKAYAAALMFQADAEREEGMRRSIEQLHAQFNATPAR